MESVESLPPCRVVMLRVMLDEADIFPMLGKEVCRGAEFDGVEVCYTYPERCVVTHETDIRFVEQVEKVENIATTEEYVIYLVEHAHRREIYVFDRKVNDRILKALEVFMRGKTCGVLLHGTYGVGKSSILKIVRGLTGCPTIEITPENVLHHHVGKTEKRLIKRLKKAIHEAPSILFIDEADVFLRTGFKRGEAQQIGSGGMEELKTNIRNILLRKFQEMHSTEPGVLVIACTNVSERAIDQAFKRAGRFDVIIHVPYPTWKMVYAFLRAYAEHIDRDKVIKVLKLHKFELSKRGLELFSKYLANLGLSMADIVSLVERCENALDIASGKKEQAYTRLVSMSQVHFEQSEVPTLVKKLVRQLRNYYETISRYPPRLCITVNIVDMSTLDEFPDQRIWLLPVLVHFLTLEGVPIFYLHASGEFDECDISCHEARGIIIANMLTFEHMSGDLLIRLTESSSPIIAINAPQKLYRYFKCIDRQVVSMYTTLATHSPEKIIKVIVENLGYRIVSEGKVREFGNRLRMLVHSERDFSKLVKEVIDIVDDLTSSNMVEPLHVSSSARPSAKHLKDTVGY